MSDERLATIMERGFETLADLLRETNERIEENGRRIEENTGQLRRLEGRFDNFISIAGGETRRLSKTVDDLERRVGALEKKAS